MIPNQAAEARGLERRERVARGTLGTLVITTLAAASHALAGGAITLWAAIVTAILAWPLCVLLAGRIGSLWRLLLAVSVSQGLYHWCFSGIGTAATYAESGEPLPAHAEHLAAFSAATGTAWTPDPGTPIPGSLALIMWVAHGVAAVVTVLILRHGERAALGLLRLVLLAVRSLVRRATPASSIHVPCPALRSHEASFTVRILSLVSGRSHRGPPVRSERAFA